MQRAFWILSPLDLMRCCRRRSKRLNAMHLAMSFISGRQTECVAMLLGRRPWMRRQKFYSVFNVFSQKCKNKDLGFQCKISVLNVCDQGFAHLHLRFGNPSRQKDPNKNRKLIGSRSRETCRKDAVYLIPTIFTLLLVRPDRQKAE